MSNEAIREYYHHFDEWGRLDTPAGQLELLNCLRVLDEHLAPHSRVLDVGGGPGRYTVELARRGHRVTLVDLCAEHVEQARQMIASRRLEANVDGLFEGDACRLVMCEAGYFDAVVAFGPIYHLVDVGDLRRAAGELSRVLRPSGRAFVQFMPPLSGFVRLLERAVDEPCAMTPQCLRRARDEGVYENPGRQGFQQGRYLEPHQVTQLFEQTGLRTQELMSINGLAAGREGVLLDIHRRDPELYGAFAELLRQSSRHPSVIAMGQTALWVGQKVK